MIRRFLLLILTIAFVFVANAQSVILSEGFDEGQIPIGWTIIDHDGDGYNWDALSWHGLTTEVFSGQGMIASASYRDDVGALAPDNWLISPAIVVPNYAALSFYIKSQDEFYADEYYSVYVSQVNTIEGFLEHPAVLTGVSTSEWDWKTVDLGDYAGETVYIAFRHHNSSDMYWLDVDEVSVVGGTEPFILTNIDTAHCGIVELGSHSIKQIPVRAFGLSSPINVSVAAPFTLSADDVTYASTAVLTPDGGPLYIKYTPSEIGMVEMPLVLSATGAASQQVEVIGVGVECVGINVFPWTESFAMVPPPCWNLIPQDDTTWTSLWYMGTWWASCVGGDSFKTEQLETDVFDFSSAIHPAMSFSFMTNPYYVVNDFFDLKVYVSIDGGSSYSAQSIWKLSQYGSFEEWVPTEACIDMLSLAGEASVKFKFSYEGRGCQMLFNELAVMDLPAVYADHIIYVKADAEGDGTGSSWGNAMRDLKAALRMASYLDTVQLWVAAGSYYGDTSLTSDNAFVMLNGVDVYGGFAGNEPADYDLSQRNLETNVTILDGLNARRVLYQPIEFSKETVWDGFTIQNGQVEGNGAGTYLRGNGILSHCIISHNMAGHGGGIFAERSSAIYNCLVSNNEALYNGGGLYMNHSTIEVVNSTIVRNLAEGSGSGVYGFGGNLRNCIVWGNIKSQMSDNIEGFDIIAYYTAVEGGYAGEANIALGDFYNNPMFVSPSNVAGDADATALVDWHLQNGSVCVNRGDNVVVTDYYDLDGTTRIKLDTVDMGCYESPFYSVPTSGCVYQTVNFTVDTCDSYTWNGRVYTQSGDYTQTFMNGSGCDSVVTMHLTVNYTTYGDTIATACDSFDWYEHTGLTQSCDNLTHTFVNAAGCDSIVTLHLTVNYTTYGDTTATACDSFDWYEHTGLTQSCDNLTHTFTNAAGCDSIVTLHLTVNYTTYGDTNAVACDSFDWYEHTGITQSCDNLTHTFTNALGCDSVVTLNLTVNYTTYADTFATACDSFDWYEHTGLTQSCDTLTHTLTNAAGCDSIVTLKLTVNYTTYADTFATACDSFDWYEHTGLTHSCDNLTHTFTNAAGCDSIVTLKLTVNYTTYGDTNATACDSFDWYEHTGLTQSCDNLTHTFTNAAGCDSIVTLHLTVNYTTYGDTLATACDSFDWYEHTGITQSCDNLTHTFTNAAGCDSIVTLHLTVNYTTYGDTLATACDSFDWYEHTGITQSCDNLKHTFTNALGCDSVVTLHLTVNYTTYGDTLATACDSFDWYEHTGLTQSCDNLTHTFTNAAGCDSIVTLHLTVNYTTYGDTTAVACDSFDWYEHTGLTQSCDNLTHTFTNALGCDSVVTLHLTVNYTTYGDTTAVACDSFDWYEHTGLTQSCDNLTHTFTNALGCDSVVTLHLTVNYTTYGDTTVVACDSFDWYEHTGLTQSCDNLTHTFTNALGCDSVVTLHLTVNYTTYGDTIANACDSFDWYEHTGITQSCDNLTHTFTNAAGCDSIVTLHLTVYPSYNVTDTQTVCENALPYTWNGKTFTGAGTMIATLESAHHCDSVVVMTLKVDAKYEQNEALTICQSELPYSWRDTLFEEGTVSNDYVFYRTSSQECDSIVTLHLTVNNTTYGDTIATACDSFDWYEHVGITQSCDNLTHTFTNALGCDSVVTLHLTVNYTTYGDTIAVACDSFDWYEHTGLTQSCDNLTHTFTNAAGCDSIVTLHLTVNYTTYGDTIAVACDSFDWCEHTGLTQSCDNLTHTFTNAAGCDSIVTLHLTVNYTTYGDTIAVACDSFDWYEHTGLTQSCDNLTHTFTNAAGCDSIVTLHLTVNYTTYGDTLATACDSFDWYEHTGLTQSCDNLTHTFTNAAGCDSIVTLHLTLNYTTYGDTLATACDSFDWYEHTGLTQSCDTLTHTFTNALGCDSVVTLHLTVNYTTYGDTLATACDSFDWYEHTGLTQSCDNLTHTFTNAAGCDSIVTLHLTVNYTTYGDTLATACDSFDWYEHTGLTQSCDNLTHTFTNAAGCDSIVTLHLTVNYTTYGDTLATACDSFDWYEHTGLTQSCDNLTHTFTNAAGCDSIVTLHLTVNYTTYGDTLATACDSFDWYEHTGLTQSCNNLTHTFTNAAGCDSIVTLHLTVNYTTYGDTLATACDSFDWYEYTGLTQSCDTLTHTFTNALGCDSVVTLHLTVNYTTYADTFATACDSFDWYEYTGLTQSCDNLTHTFTNAAGCDSIVTLHLTVNYTTYADTFATVCDSFDWYEHTGLTQSCDTLTHTFTNAAGCDSIVTLHLTVNYTTYADTFATVCDSFDWYEHTGLTQSCDNLTHIFTNASGCDSIVTLYLTVNYTTYADTFATACDSFDWYEHTGLIQSCDNLTHTFTNASGCDSIVTLHLTVNYTTYADTFATACDSFDWYEHTGLTQSCDNLMHTFTNAAGCDSIVTLHLTVNYTTYADTFAVVCDSFDWYEHTGLTQSCDNLTHTFTNASGCDSIVTLHLTVNYTTYADTFATVCDRFDWYEHTGLTQSCDTLTHTFTNAAGCDSIVTLHLTVNYTTYADTFAVVCDSFDWYEHTGLTQSCDNLTHTFTNAAGCDSIVTLHLTVNYTTYADTFAVVCDSFDWYEHTGLTQSCDNLTHTFTNAAGCDSIVTLHLTVNYTTYGDTTAVACDSFDWYEHTDLTQSCDNLTHTFTNAAGCDSIVTLHLTINNSVVGFFEATACDSFTWNEVTYTESGEYVQTFPAANGCDSVVTLLLTINNSVSELIEATACESYTWNGVTYTESGDYTQIFPGANDCDFILTLRLTINTPVTEFVEDTACDIYMWNEEIYTESGDYVQIFPASNGCDSVVTLHLTINNSVEEFVEVAACYSYTWNDSVYTESGEYTQTFNTVDGCDSVVTILLSIGTPVAESFEATVCDSYTWNDSVYTVSGDYTQTFATASGCDSVVTLHLTVNNSVTEFVEVTACNSYTWNAVVYTESGNYTQIFPAANSCDSVVILQLTINNSVAGSFEATACDSYTWNGVTYTASGDYTQTFPAANGCDSVVTLHLTIHESVTIDVYLTINESDLPYTYGDTTFEPGTVQSGDYYFNFTTAEGCDSIIVLHLTVETGVPNHVLASDMKVYPNPTTGSFFVEFEDVNSNTQLQIYDIYGKLIMQYNINDRLTELNIGHLANGVYMLRMIDGNSGSKMVKLVKQ